MTPFSATGRPIIIISFLIRPVVDQQAILWTIRCIIWFVIFLSDYRSLFFFVFTIVSSYSNISINFFSFFFQRSFFQQCWKHKVLFLRSCVIYRVFFFFFSLHFTFTALNRYQDHIRRIFFEKKMNDKTRKMIM